MNTPIKALEIERDIIILACNYAGPREQEKAKKLLPQYNAAIQYLKTQKQ